LDFHSSGATLFYSAFFEVAAVFWIYGGKRLARNIKTMNGETVNIFFLLCWYVVSPLFIFTVWLLNWIQFEPIKYGNYEYPLTMKIFGWLITLVSISAIPLAAAHTLAHTPGSSLYNV
jgi:hypothetical protein